MGEKDFGDEIRANIKDRLPGERRGGCGGEEDDDGDDDTGVMLWDGGREECGNKFNNK